MATTPKQRLMRGAAGQIAEERLKRLQNQNAKLQIEVQRLRGEVGPIEQFRQEVIKCNVTAKLQILAAPIRIGPEIGLTKEQTESIKHALVAACNDLAFENLRPVHECPTCGAKLARPKEKEAE